MVNQEAKGICTSSPISTSYRDPLHETVAGHKRQCYCHNLFEPTTYYGGCGASRMCEGSFPSHWALHWRSMQRDYVKQTEIRRERFGELASVDWPGVLCLRASWNLRKIYHRCRYSLTIFLLLRRVEGLDTSHVHWCNWEERYGECLLCFEDVEMPLIVETVLGCVNNPKLKTSWVASDLLELTSSPSPPCVG